MAHRRKSSHPVCKTRRNFGPSWETKQADTDEESFVDQDDIPRSPRSDQEKGIAIETDSESGQHIMIPPDLYKDFEAVRSQTKMDTTDLMRRLLKDYQSIATVKTSASDDHGETDYTHTSVSLASQASIASDVSLATTRVDDEDEFQGLDLTVKPSRRIDSRLFDTKSLNCESYEEQPLDLTCTKPPLDGETNRESPSSSQIDMNTVNNEFNYVYVYPGLYPPNSGLMGQDDMPCESPKGGSSPVPDLISPTEVTSFETPVQNQYMSSNMAIEPSLGLMNPSMAYHSLMSSMTKGPLSPDIPDDSTRSTQLTTSIKLDKPVNERIHAKHIRKAGRGGTRALPMKGVKHKEKKPPEMKVISENTAYPGVYTSVMKLPWSRRTRTKKPKHKVKLEDTLVPQFMIEQERLENQARESAAMEPMMTEMKFDPVASTPESSSSVMMVYPNATASSQGKPVRKRGRPPKLPMLAKLLQHQQNQKRLKKEKQNAVKVESEPAQQTVTNGGMVLYNANQFMQTFGVPVPATSGQEQAQQSQPTVLSNMSQAQLIGQFPLSHFTGGPIQFLGQFPASSIPLQGQTAIQPMPMVVQEDGQLTPQTEVKGSAADQTATSKDVPISPAMPTVNYQYAFQPMIIPAPAPPQIPVPSATASIDETLKDETNIKHQNLLVPKQESIEIDPGNTDGLITSSSNLIGSMSTTSVSNTSSGAIYQEMILSSKSLVDVKKRKRQTAIQLLKSKSSDQNFLCTSFRIRPRLVAQAQAQKERQAVKDSTDLDSISEISSIPKNLNSPQNDFDNHFGDNSSSLKQSNGEFDMSAVQIKREVDIDDIFDDLPEYDIGSKQLVIDTDALTDNVQIKTEPLDDLEGTTIAQKPNSTKRFMLKGSQKRKAKGLKSKFINDICKKARHVVCSSTMNRGNDTSVMDVTEHEVLTKTQNDMYQELFNCKICNKIIPVDQMEVHSLEHLQRKSSYRCGNCGSNFENIETKENEDPTCTICRYTLTSNPEPQVFTRYGQGKIACDECPEAFKSLPEFYEHKTEVHKNDKALQGDFECDFCGKTYQYYHALQFHRRTHRERRVPCLDKTCSMRFRSRKEMEIHFDSKHPDKKEYFHCVYDGCSKKFLKNFHLQEHIRVKHYNIRAFQCPWPGCIKEFAAQRHLKIHLLIHRDEKPMKCDHCDYRCRQRSAMNWHMRKHPDVPYKYKRSVKSPSVSTTESE